MLYYTKFGVSTVFAAIIKQKTFVTIWEYKEKTLWYYRRVFCFFEPKTNGEMYIQRNCCEIVQFVESLF